MDEFKKMVQSSFRTEMIGAGLYSALSRQYGRKNSTLGERLKRASEDEHMHGRLFRQFYSSAFNQNPGGEKLWMTIGGIIACLQLVIPLEKKLKTLSAIEAKAVRQIEDELKGGADSPFHKILKRILPDEKSHAAIYNEFYNKN